MPVFRGRPKGSNPESGDNNSEIPGSGYARHGMTKGSDCMDDIEELTALNRDYVASVQNSNVKRFDEILASEFYCSNPDKSLVDRAAFLKQTAVPVTIKNCRAEDVKIRVLGDFAIIHAATSYTTADGQQARGRYTDCWAKQNGKWLAVSAHVSR